MAQSGQDTIPKEEHASPTEDSTKDVTEVAAAATTTEEIEGKNNTPRVSDFSDSLPTETEKPFSKRIIGKRTNRNKAVFVSYDDSDPSCRVFVGNLSYEVTWKELKDHMKTSGSEVLRSDVLAFPDGRSKGCGIVSFADSEGAQKALLLNDTELLGRQIFVREDRESENHGGGYYVQQSGLGNGNGNGHAHAHGSSFSAGGRLSGKEKQSCRVYVGNLSWEVAWQDLKDHMRQAGEVVFAEVMTEPDGRSKGCGICEYASPEEAQKACAELSNTELKDRMIFVREDRESSSGRGYQPQAGTKGRNSVYVGNLSYETSWQDLKDHMRQAGNVDQANILQTEDGRSKGCGIVVFQKASEAARATRELHNSTLNGRPIIVREDRESGGRQSRFVPKKGYRAAPASKNKNIDDTEDGCQLFVNNLSWDTTWQQLKDHFRQCGEVERVEVIEGPDGRKKGFGTVRFYNAEDAENAIQTLNGVELQGRELGIRYDSKVR